MTLNQWLCLSVPSSLKISLQTSCDCQWKAWKLRVSLSTHPCVDLALVATHNGLDVVLHDRDQGVLVIDLADPAGQLAVPDEGVATDQFAVGGGPVDKVVRVGKLEVATRGLGGIELHRVLGSDLAEVGLGHIVDGGVGNSSLVESGTPVSRRASVMLINNHKFHDQLTSCPWP
jgi:hypothetical protein